MHLQPYLSPSPRLTRPWHLALIIALLVGVVLPPPALAAPTWTNTAPMGIARGYHSTTLLPSGKVLVAGGTNGNGFVAINSAEVYDSNANTWTTVAPLNNRRDTHTATLLPNGKVLVMGGHGASGLITASAEVYDRGLGFDEGWRPTLNTVSSPLTPGNPLSLTGSGFRGYQFSEAADGGTNNSATNYPLVQIRLWITSNGCGCRPVRLTTPRSLRCP